MILQNPKTPKPQNPVEWSGRDGRIWELARFVSDVTIIDLIREQSKQIVPFLLL